MALQRKSNHAKTDDGTMGMGAIKKDLNAERRQSLLTKLLNGGVDDDDDDHVHDDCGYCV